MWDYALPMLYGLFVWWFSTGLIIYLDGLPRHTFRWSMLGATLVLGLSLYALAVSSADTSVAGAYIAFTAGLLAWGWQQMSFYTGYITGPRKARCPEGCRGWRHFIHAIETCLYHELVIIVAAAVVVALTWGQPNQIGTWTFIVLWWMHQSAKLNVFLGVRNLSEEFIPDHMEYLKGFLNKKPMNLLFPISVTISTVIAVLLFQAATALTATPFEAAGYTFLASLMALAILEHWFLVLPLPAAALWHWGLKSREHTQNFDLKMPIATVRGFNPDVRTVPASTGVASSVSAAAKAQTAGTPSLPVLQGRSEVSFDDCRGENALGLQSWSTRLSGPCDPRVLRTLLDGVVRGAFGQVERVKGVAETEAGWIHFDVAGGQRRIAAFAPGEREQPRVVAIGRGVDEIGLQAAFEACSVPAVS